MTTSAVREWIVSSRKSTPPKQVWRIFSQFQSLYDIAEKARFRAQSVRTHGLYSLSSTPIDLEFRGRAAFDSEGTTLESGVKYGRLRIGPLETPQSGQRAFFEF